MSGLYDYRWQSARRRFLAANPLCARCKRMGRTASATVVDHVEPHRGDLEKFWDTFNWQALCKACHDGPKQEYEKSGRVRGCDPDGNPIDPNHHWAA